MTAYDKFTGFFFFSLLIGCGYLIYTSANDRQECAKAAIAQNYPADQIKKICH